MTLAIPCEACGIPLHHDVVTLRFATFSLVPGGEARSNMTPKARQEYLVCTGCASYVQSCVEFIEARMSGLEGRRAAS